jgi:hypothetical protein
MPTMDRRRFLALTAATLPGIGALSETPAGSTATIKLHLDQLGPTVPANFIGLSYETQQLSDPSFFSAANKGLIAQFRALSARGVLRLGGNTSDYGFWKPAATSVAPPRAKREYKVGDPPPDLSYAVTPEAVDHLHGFLVATGWSCLYGINLGTNTPDLAAAEAAYVWKTLGKRLEYFQIGNEADRFGSTIRDAKTWGVDAFLAEWLTFANSIIAAVPDARFGMPDIASNASWFEGIGNRLANHPIGAHIACLTHHYYIGGPPSNPEMTIEHILKDDPKVRSVAGIVSGAAVKLNTSWRMTEGNTCYRGGKPGVSDVFAASLWAADYYLTLASLGYAGVNLHGGDGQMIAIGLGGTLPGEELMTDSHVPHSRPFYTPIAHMGEQYVAEPVSYGMKFAQCFAGATMLPLDFDPGQVNATAYAGKRAEDGRVLVAVLNKDLTQDLTIRFEDPVAACTARLTAPSLSSRAVSWDGRTIERAAVKRMSESGVQRKREVGCVVGGKSGLTFRVPRSSGVLIDLVYGD